MGFKPPFESGMNTLLQNLYDGTKAVFLKPIPRGPWWPTFLLPPNSHGIGIEQKCRPTEVPEDCFEEHGSKGSFSAALKGPAQLSVAGGV